MPTYWDSFIRKYEKEIPNLDLRSILNAFWLYSNSHVTYVDQKECDKIMKGK